VNWLNFGDSDLVTADDRWMVHRFVKPININKCTTYDFPDNFHVKSIIRGGLEKVEWEGVSHTPSNKLKCCNAFGIECDSTSPLTPYDYRNAGLRHFCTKTAEEYSEKIERGFPDANSISKQSMVELFFERNEITKEKVEVFKERNGIDVSYLLPSKYDGEKRNPWNEIECGNNYARSMASFALLPIYSGFTFDMTKKHIGFAPINKGGKYVFSVAESWGTVEIDNSECHIYIYGHPLELSSILIPCLTTATNVTVDGNITRFKIADGKILLDNIVINREIHIR
jgi:hypothetical protein